MKKLCLINYLIFILPIFATNHYVDKNALGSNNGTSWLNAWTQITNIEWSLIQPGDTVYISGGT